MTRRWIVWVPELWPASLCRGRRRCLSTLESGAAPLLGDHVHLNKVSRTGLASVTEGGRGFGGGRVAVGSGMCRTTSTSVWAHCQNMEHRKHKAFIHLVIRAFWFSWPGCSARVLLFPPQKIFLNWPTNTDCWDFLALVASCNWQLRIQTNSAGHRYFCTGVLMWQNRLSPRTTDWSLAGPLQSVSIWTHLNVCVHLSRDDASV